MDGKNQTTKLLFVDLGSYSFIVVLVNLDMGWIWSGFGLGLPWKSVTMPFYTQTGGLTPKGPLVPTGDKPDLGYFVWSHTIFRILEFFLPTRSLNKLHVNTNFMILETKVMDV
jgi:hypothetical protein